MWTLRRGRRGGRGGVRGGEGRGVQPKCQVEINMLTVPYQFPVTFSEKMTNIGQMDTFHLES